VLCAAYCVLRKESLGLRKDFLKNKANSPKGIIGVSPFVTKDYRNTQFLKAAKNKANYPTCDRKLEALNPKS
jgi:hypothetical protein